MKWSQQKSKRHGVQRLAMEARCPQRLRSSVGSGSWHSSLPGFKLTISNQAAIPSPSMMLFFLSFLSHCKDAPLSLSSHRIFGWVLQSTFKEWAVMLAQTSQEWKMYIIYLKFLHKRGLHFTTDLLIYLVMCLCQYTLWTFILYFYYNLILLHLFSVFKLSPFTHWRVFS